MSPDLSSVIAATARWLVTAYPASGTALGSALVATQARQAVTVAAWLRYPTEMDADLLHLVGPGGARRLDRVGNADLAGAATPEQPWRTWVDEVVASWAACLLGDAGLAQSAVDALARTEHAAGLAFNFRRLLAPEDADQRAGVLLRHPDLLAPVADLHRQELYDLLIADARVLET